MSTAAAQAAAFYRESLAAGEVYVLWGPQGAPTARNGAGEHAMPVWSKRSRAEKVVANVPAYAGYEVRAMPLGFFREEWLPDLAREDLRVGLNWSGAHAVGYDLDPESVEETYLGYEESG